MLDSQKVALAAHVHVLLRRKTGRVTDTEWMVQNAEYAREVVRFARAHAAGSGDRELDDYARKLEATLLGEAAGAAPRALTALERLRENARTAAPPPRPAEERAVPPPRYVGGLR